MFSAYVVVGEPPNALEMCGRDAVGTDRTAHVGVEVLAGHLGDGLDVAGVLRDERDDAGQDEQDRAVSENDGPWTTETPSARVPLGRPIQLAASTPAHETRSCSVASVGAAEDGGDGTEDEVGEPGQQVAEDQGEEDRDAQPETGEHHGRERP